jgi:hypothetical protein
MRTDRQTDMPKSTVAFRNFAKARKTACHVTCLLMPCSQDPLSLHHQEPDETSMHYQIPIPAGPFYYYDPTFISVSQQYRVYRYPK